MAATAAAFALAGVATACPWCVFASLMLGLLYGELQFLLAFEGMKRRLNPRTPVFDFFSPPNTRLGRFQSLTQPWSFAILAVVLWFFPRNRIAMTIAALLVVSSFMVFIFNVAVNLKALFDSERAARSLLEKGPFQNSTPPSIISNQ